LINERPLADAGGRFRCDEALFFLSACAAVEDRCLLAADRKIPRNRYSPFARERICRMLRTVPVAQFLMKRRGGVVPRRFSLCEVARSQ